jgi:hypothetical protein
VFVCTGVDQAQELGTVEQLLLMLQVCVCVCVCERERKCERVSAFSLCEWGCARHRSWSDVYVVCVVCVCA